MSRWVGCGTVKNVSFFVQKFTMIKYVTKELSSSYIDYCFLRLLYCFKFQEKQRKIRKQLLFTMLRLDAAHLCMK